MDAMFGDLDFSVAYYIDKKQKPRTHETGEIGTFFKKIKKYVYKLNIDKCNILKQQWNT